MIDPIMSYANIMRMEINRMNSIASNSTNVNTDGYLQEKTYVNSTQFLDSLSGKNEAEKYGTAHDLKLGALRLTKRPLDIAINSNDWFQLEASGGALVTRNGHFSLGEDGSLQVGKYKVLGKNGVISNLKPGFAVRANGSIYEGNDYIDQIRLVKIKSEANLASLGEGVYSSRSSVEESKSPQVVQGALLGSNVDIQSDMTKIIEMSRHIEMLQRAMTAYSSVLDVGINQIGK